MRIKIPLMVLAAFMPVALGLCKWVNVLEARFEERLATPQPLHLVIMKSNTLGVRNGPLLSDIFTLSLSGLRGYKSGYQSEDWEDWKVKRLEFRGLPKQKWKIWPESWHPNWKFLKGFGVTTLPNGTRKMIFTVNNYLGKIEIKAGHYRMRARFKKEFHDDHSGIRYIGAGTFDFLFHVDSVPNWGNRVILDSVAKVD